MQMILLTVLINIAAIAIWSVVTGQNGFSEAAKMLRGEAAFIRTSKVSSKGQVGKGDERITGGGERTVIAPIPGPSGGSGGGANLK